MLQHGAAKVIAVDTGYGQMDFGLRNHPHLRLLEKTNARYLVPSDIGEPIGFIAMDVSFISATLVLPRCFAPWRLTPSPCRGPLPDCRPRKTAVRSGRNWWAKAESCATNRPS